MFDFFTNVIQKIGAAIGAGLIAVGGLVGGQPITYQQNIEVKAPTAVEMPAQASSSPDVASEIQLKEESAKEEKFIPTLQPKAVAQKTIDVCPNIEGVQTTVPVGFTSSSGACVAVEDLCNNIQGVQTSIPLGMSLTRQYGCLTDAEVESVGKTTAGEEAALAEQAESEALIARKKEVKASIDRYNRYLEEIRYGYYECVKDASGSCPDPYTPRYPIPNELQVIWDSVPEWMFGGGNSAIIPSTWSGEAMKYLKEKINFILLDLQAEYNQLSI